MKKQDLIEYALSVALLLLLLAACQAVNQSHQAEDDLRHAPIEETKPLHSEIDTSLLPSQQSIVLNNDAVVRAPQLASFIWNGIQLSQISPPLNHMAGRIEMPMPG